MGNIMKIGYARVSDIHQKLEIQIEALEKAGCEKIYSEKITGKNNDRPEFIKLMNEIKEGDVLVVCKMDRLIRSLKGLLEISEDLSNAKADLISLNSGENIDTTTPMGKAFFHMMGILAELERQLILERTAGGRKKAIANGVQFGRKKGTILPKTIVNLEMVDSFLKNGYTQYQISKKLKMSESNVHNLVKKLPLLEKMIQDKVVVK